MTSSLSTFSILQFLDQLTPDNGSHSKNEGSYFCPLCEAKNFKVDLKTGKYNSFGCGCTATASGRKAIRDAVAPLEWQKPHRVKQKRTWTYADSSGRALIKVHRQDDGQGKRSIWQKALVPGSITELKEKAYPYRYRECLAAIEHGKLIFWVEGEPCADALWNIGIPATTTLGGTNNYRSKQYRELFPDKSLVICPDRDQAGLKYADAIATDYPNAAWCYPYPASFLWNRLPKSSGADIADWILEGATAQEIFAAVGKKRCQAELTKTDDVSSNHSEDKPNFLKRAYLQIEQLWKERLRFNDFTKEIELDGESVDIGSLKVDLALEENLNLSLQNLELILNHLAKRNTYHPVQNYLTLCSKEYDNIEILNNLAERYFGVKHPLYNIFLKRTLIAAVARTFNPGCKVDTALILQGQQGLRKSSFFKALAGADYFDDSLGAISDKDQVLKLHQTWFVEWAELETVFKRREVAALKAFLSCGTDVVRAPYARQSERMQRQSIIVGTTNQDEFLSDQTGNRRFWIIPVKKDIDIELLENERDRIWAAAVALYRAGEQWWLTPTEELAAQNLAQDYQTTDPWESRIDAHLVEWRLTTVTTSQLLTNCLEIDAGHQTRANEMRVADCLKRLGWKSTRKSHLGKRRRVWVNPNQPGMSYLEEVDTLENPEGISLSEINGQPGQPKAASFASADLLQHETNHAEVNSIQHQLE